MDERKALERLSARALLIIKIIEFPYPERLTALYAVVMDFFNLQYGPWVSSGDHPGVFWASPGGRSGVVWGSFGGRSEIVRRLSGGRSKVVRRSFGYSAEPLTGIR